MLQRPEEIMGSFYLGAEYDTDKNDLTNKTVHYDARDLTTHAVCVGMTGSGKTGLCIGLLEEAALDKVPALIIDPKGDMTNLLLQFEDLSPEEFKPWVNPDDASRKGLTLDEYAEKTAKNWEEGLADWGQDTERIKKLKSSVDYTIFTPGSSSGVSVNIMGSFAAPKLDFDSHVEMLRERIQGTVAALLGMIKSNADPVRSPEGILLCTLFEHHWKMGEDLDLTKLIQGIQQPPVRQMGVFDVDTFFPQKDRFALAMEFNTLVASPQFQYWLQGEDLDIDKLYFTAEGKPRHSIFYIAHLSDQERMFFVTLLLNNLITWMRKQSGTTSLRSLLYFDEVFGYFPPSANPPSKQPLLTLLKQARAFGVGTILVTQNPVDIDYKGLSNAGTWFIGKLQTERDKARLLEGLKSAVPQDNENTTQDFDALISGLSSRVFVLHNVHEDAPTIYHTRWAMSYLRGPMTRLQVQQLMEGKKEAIKDAGDSDGKKSASISDTPLITTPPQLNPEIAQHFLEVWMSGQEAKSKLGSSTIKLVYKPCLWARGTVRFSDAKNGIDVIRKFCRLTNQADRFGRIPWKEAKAISNPEEGILTRPDKMEGVTTAYESVPESMSNVKSWKKFESELDDYLYAHEKLTLLKSESLGLVQGAEESPSAFQNRLQQALREARDTALDELQKKYAEKLERLEDKIQQEERDLEEAEAEKSARTQAEWINAAETLFSVFVKGRKRSLGSATTKRRMARKASNKVESAEEDLQEAQQDYEEMEARLKDEMAEVRNNWEKAGEVLSEYNVPPRRSDIIIDHLGMIWKPFWVGDQDQEVSAVKKM